MCSPALAKSRKKSLRGSRVPIKARNYCLQHMKHRVMELAYCWGRSEASAQELASRACRLKGGLLGSRRSGSVAFAINALLEEGVLHRMRDGNFWIEPCWWVPAHPLGPPVGLFLGAGSESGSEGSEAAEEGSYQKPEATIEL